MAPPDPQQKYLAFREAACEFVQEHYESKVFTGELEPLMDGLRIHPIGDDAIAAWKISQTQWRFDWGAWIDLFTRNDPDRFDVAVWHNDDLHALGIGRPSAGNDNVTIHVLERRQDYVRLKGWVAQIVTDTAEAYAKILGKQRVKLKDPVQEAIPTYEKLRFLLAERIGNTRYYARRVEP